MIAELLEGMYAELPEKKPRKLNEMDKLQFIMKGMSMITGLHHVSLKCELSEGFEKAKSFYINLLWTAWRRN